MVDEISFSALFAKAFNDGRAPRAPYPFQSRLADEGWPDILIAPTGIGKTAAVTLAWAFKRLSGDVQTPRRLVWCLPMRTLVEQTADESRRWMTNLADDWQSTGRDAPPDIHVLLGGEVDKDWVIDPARETIIVGTQDMLISRALMRGYGMSRFRWPIDFALLHTDSLWVFDEVQLMGAGLATSAQLEAFRRRDGRFMGVRSKSLWVSATLDPSWLATVDFRKQVPDPIVHRLNDKEAPEPAALTTVLDASKTIAKLDGIKSADDSGKKLGEYAKCLGEAVLLRHKKGRPTLVVVNRVARAQAVYAAVKATDPKSEVLLLHSRFRQKERTKIVERIRAMKKDDDLIVISTQAIEAGVDISACVMIAELAPWSSMVQRFGRCKRRGEFGTKQGGGEGGEIFWIDAADDDKAARPYDLVELQDARKQLSELTDAAPRNLAAASHGPEARHVIRRKDFEELFDTDSDLMGFDIDIAPYVRDAEDTDVRLFWRVLPEKEEELDAALKSVAKPQRNELCPAPMGGVNEWLKRKGVKNRIFRLDILADSKKKVWAPLAGRDARRIKPGDVLMVACELGGYDPDRGFDPSSAKLVSSAFAIEKTPPLDDGDTIGDDPASQRQKAISLEDHLVHVRDAARQLCMNLKLPESISAAVIRAAAWHDVGKSHEQFQLRAVRSADDPALPLAKARSGNWRKTTHQPPLPDLRPYFRHELASALAFLAQHDERPEDDLVAYLIAAHHGKVRMGLRSLPGETAPEEPGRLFARGVWHGDELPEVRVGDETSAATMLSLDLMRMGDSEKGRPSWSARTFGLLLEHGPFKLAFLEAIVRLADWKASEDEQKDGAP